MKSNNKKPDPKVALGWNYFSSFSQDFPKKWLDSLRLGSYDFLMEVTSTSAVGETPRGFCRFPRPLAAPHIPRLRLVREIPK